MNTRNKIKKADLRRSGWRLSRQITNLVTLSLFAMVLSVSVVTSFIISRSLTHDFIRNGKNIAAVLAEQVSVSVLVGSPAGAEQAINVIESFPSISKVAVYELDGRLLAQSGSQIDWNDSNKKWMFELDSAMLEIDQKQYWQFISPVFADSAEPELEDLEANRKQRNVTGLVRIQMDKNQLFSARKNIIFGNFLVLVLFALVLVLLLDRLGRALTKPLETFVKTMMSGSSGTAKNLRVELAGSREMKQLSDAFNQMMEILEDREAELASTRDKALEAARLKSEFAANVSHEIRTPLNGIVGILSLLNDSSLNAKQREYVSLAESASDALMTMINDILDFSRLSLDDSLLATTEFDLRSLLEELVFLHAQSKDSRNLDLIFFYDITLPYIVESDPNKIRQLLNNLINNAAKFTDKGSVFVKAEKETDAEGKLWIRLSVIDSGIGIDEKDLHTIFLPYAQSDGSMNRKYSGTGLGLTISEKLAELLHGDIGVSSEKNVGSEFFVRIPFRYSQSVSHLHNTMLLGDKKKVWLYAPSEQMLSATKNMCQHQNIDVNAYTNMALLTEDLLHSQNNKVNSQTVKLVVCYLSVNDENDKSIRQVEALATQAKVKIILLSREDDSCCKDINNIEIMRPPVRSLVLAQAIERALMSQVASENSQENKDHSLGNIVLGKRILLVEDNEINQRVALAMLNKMGCDVSIVENGAKALSLVEANDFDLILMDCQMPVMNGYEATRAIRKLADAKKSIPIVAMTANVGTQEQIHCFEAGMNDFLAKPIKLPTLLVLLSKWLVG